LADEIADLMATEPGVDFSFEVQIQADSGSPLSAETKEKLNEVLSRISDELRF